MAIQVYGASRLIELSSRLIEVRETSVMPLLVLCRTSAIQTLLGHQIARLAYESNAHPTPVRLMTFSAWLDDLWIRAGDGRTPVDAIRRRIALEGILEQWSGDLPLSLTSPGGSRVLEAVCENYSVKDDTPHHPGSLVTLIQTIATRYLDVLDAERLIDTGGIVSSLQDAFPPLDYQVVLYGFSDLTDPQRTILRKAAQVVPVAAMAFSESTTPCVEHVLAMARLIDDEVEYLPADGKVSHADTRSDTDDLTLVARQSFGEKAQTATGDGSVSFHRVYGSAAQLATLLAEIKRLRSHREVNRVAVVHPALEKLLPTLVRELDRARIPYAFDIETTLGATEFGDAFLALLSLGCGQRDADTVFRFTGSLVSDYTKEEAALYDRELRIGSGLAPTSPRTMLLRMIHWFDTHTAQSSSVLHALCRCVEEPSVENWQELLDNLLANAVHRGFVHGYQQTATLATYRVIVAALEELSEVCRRSVSALTFADVLARCSIQMTPVPGTRDVWFSTPRRMDGLVFDAVICAGIDSRTFRSSVLPSNVDQVLTRMGLGSFTDVESLEIEKLLAKRNQYYESSMLQSPQKHLSLIYQMADDEGHALQPSGFLEEVVAQFQLPGQSFSEALAEHAHPEVMEYSSPQVRGLIQQAPGDPAFETVPLVGHGEMTQANTAADGPLSASQIELYAKCPFKWFLLYLVGLAEFDRQLDARDTGSLVHALLFSVLSRFREEQRRAITDEVLDKALHLKDEVIAHEQQEYPSPLISQRPEEYVRALEYVRISIESEPQLNEMLENAFTPTLFEYEIAPEDQVVIGGARIRGRIDRIDLSPTHYAVIDYKGSVGSAAKLIEERSIQAGIYLLALERLGRGKESALLGDKRPAAAIYKSYKTGAVSALADTSVVSLPGAARGEEHDGHAAFMAALEEIERIVEAVVSSMRDGQIRPLEVGPPSDYLCATCPYLRCGSRKKSFR